MPSPSTFTGSVPGNYDLYMGPLFFEPYAEDLVARIDSSKVQQALEIACGTGRVTRHLRNALAPAAMPATASIIFSGPQQTIRRLPVAASASVCLSKSVTKP